MSAVAVRNNKAEVGGRLDQLEQEINTWAQYQDPLNELSRAVLGIQSDVQEIRWALTNLEKKVGDVQAEDLQEQVSAVLDVLVATKRDMQEVRLLQQEKQSENRVEQFAPYMANLEAHLDTVVALRFSDFEARCFQRTEQQVQNEISDIVTLVNRLEGQFNEVSVVVEAHQQKNSMHFDELRGSWGELQLADGDQKERIATLQALHDDVQTVLNEDVKGLKVANTTLTQAYTTMAQEVRELMALCRTQPKVPVGQTFRMPASPDVRKDFVPDVPPLLPLQSQELRKDFVPEVGLISSTRSSQKSIDGYGPKAGAKAAAQLSPSLQSIEPVFIGPSRSRTASLTPLPGHRISRSLSPQQRRISSSVIQQDSREQGLPYDLPFVWKGDVSNPSARPNVYSSGEPQVSSAQKLFAEKPFR